MTTVFAARVEHGKLVIENPTAWREVLASWDGPCHVVLRKQKKDRSNNQNRYYWGCVVKIAADHFGYTSQEFHDAMKLMFLKREGLGPATIGSTATMSTVEFMDFLAKVQQFCAEQNLVIPDPQAYEASLLV